MWFLCPEHCQPLVMLPQDEKISIWHNWMDQAFLSYQLQPWRDAAPYAGCAGVAPEPVYH